MKNVPAHGQTTTGVDLSHWDPQVNWPMLKAGGCGFIIFKATEGSSVTDPSFQKNWEAANANGMIRGAYHFFHPAQDPIAQAKHFCATVGKLEAFDLPPIIDWEANDNEPAKIDLQRGLAFLQYVEKFFGKTPVIYGGPYFLQALSLTPDFAKYPLWVAHYTHGAPLVPPPWTSWAIWQYSDRAGIPGVGPAGHGTCDANLFNGTLADLKVFIAKLNHAPAPVAAVAMEQPAVEAAPKAKPKKET